MQTIKKPISFLLSLVMILSVFTIAPVRTHAQTEGDWVFTTFGQGSVINQYTGSGGDVTVPDPFSKQMPEEDVILNSTASGRSNAESLFSTTFVPSSSRCDS